MCYTIVWKAGLYIDVLYNYGKQVDWLISVLDMYLLVF